MAGFLYYLEGRKRGMTLDQIGQAGVGYAFERVPTQAEVTRGPGEAGPGVILADDRHVAAVGFYPDRQTWRKIPNAEAWVGMLHDQPLPGPEDLRRAGAQGGHLVRLADGREWEIPVVRGVTEVDGAIVPYCALPRAMDLDEHGAFVPGALPPDLDHIYSGVIAYFDALVRAAESDERRIQFNDKDEIVTKLIGLNYRVAAVEVVMLGLLRWNGPEASEVMGAAMDLPGFEALQKKREAAGSST